MTSPRTEKYCAACGETKPAEEYYRDRATHDGLSTYCAACSLQQSTARQAKRRANLGDVAYRAEQAAKMKRWRSRTGNAQGKAYSAARRRAQTRLALAHPDEYAALLAEERAR